MQRSLQIDTFPVSQGGSATTYNDGTGLPNGGASLFGQTVSATGFSSAGWTSGSGTSNYLTDASTTGYAGQVDWEGVQADNNTRTVARNLSTPQGGNPYVYYTATELVRDVDSSAPDRHARLRWPGIRKHNFPCVRDHFGNPDRFLTSGSLKPVQRIREAWSSALVSLLLQQTPITVLVNADPSSVGYVGSSIAGNEYLVITKAETNVVGSQDRITYWVNPTNLSSEAGNDRRPPNTPMPVRPC